MDSLSHVYLTSHSSRKLTGTPGQRRPVTVSGPHRQTNLYTSALFAMVLATPSSVLAYETSPGLERGSSRFACRFRKQALLPCEPPRSSGR
jgi:hypothetical protein